MTVSRRTTMRIALRAAAAGKLEQGSLYLSTSEKPTPDTPCLLVNVGPDDALEAIALESGFPQEGLDTATIEDTAKCACEPQLRANETDRCAREYQSCRRGLGNLRLSSSVLMSVWISCACFRSSLASRIFPAL